MPYLARFCTNHGEFLWPCQVERAQVEQMNPDCMVPVLELDSGAAITDIIAICRYFEELHPDPSLMGRSAEERAVIESWLRQIEWEGSLTGHQCAYSDCRDGVSPEAQEDYAYVPPPFSSNKFCPRRLFEMSLLG